MLTNSDYVRLLSGLSLVGFPVEMEVENRGSQLNALKLLIADMPGADLHVEFAPDNQGIDVKGVVPTVADQQRIIRSIRQEMPSLRNITFQIDSPEETAKSLAKLLLSSAGELK